MEDKRMDINFRCVNVPQDFYRGVQELCFNHGLFCFNDSDATDDRENSDSPLLNKVIFAGTAIDKPCKNKTIIKALVQSLTNEDAQYERLSTLVDLVRPDLLTAGVDYTYTWEKSGDTWILAIILYNPCKEIALDLPQRILKTYLKQETVISAEINHLDYTGN